jgi:hypothetical protein
MRASVGAQTAKDYELAWRRWRIFVHAFTDTAISIDLDDSQYLPRGNRQSNDLLIAQYAEYIFTEFAVGAERASALVSALGHFFMTRGGDTAAFHSPQLAAVRKGMANQPLPDDWESNQRLPMPVDMMKSDKHVLLAKSIPFEVTLPYQEPQFYAAHEVAEKGIRRCHVTLVRIQFKSSKTFNQRAGRAIWFSVPGAGASVNLPKILFEWAISAQLSAEVPFLLWPIPGSTLGHRDALSYVHMTAEIKAIAEEFGFSPKRFGCHRVRVGGASLLRAAGASDSLILLIGRWCSLPACLGYQEASTDTHDNLLRVLLTKGLYTTRDVRIRYPQPRCETWGPQYPTHPDKENGNN